MGPITIWRPLAGGLGWLFAFSVAVNVLTLALPLHMMAIYDRVLPSGSTETLVYITLIVAVALVVLGAAEGLRLMLCQRLGARLIATHGDALLRRALDGAGERTGPRELTALQHFVASRAFASLFDLPFVPLFVGLMFLLHPWLGAATVGGILLLCLIAWLHLMLARGAMEAARRHAAEMDGFAAQVLRARENARALGMAGGLGARWGRYAADAMRAADGLARAGSIGLGVTRTVRQVMQVLVLAVGAWLVLADQLSAGVIFGASIIFGRAVAPVEQVIASLDRILRAREDVRAVARALDGVEGPERHARGIEVEAKPLGRVELISAGLSGAGEAGEAGDVGETGDDGTVLTNVSFTLEPAKVLAIIGPSRAGKSAIARIVAGAVAPSEGAVRLDGHDPAPWTDARRTRMIGYVAQDAPLFPGSIADNIARFDPALDEERVLWAARFAGAHEMIADLPDGYATMVGLECALGAGHRQLVALARALYARPRLLVLDEPNAYLDQHGEAHFLRMLTNARHEGMGSIVVSQRRSVLHVADYIATVNGGRLASFEENRGQWKRRAGDQRRRDALHDEARELAARVNSAVALADQLSRSLGVDVRPS